MRAGDGGLQFRGAARAVTDCKDGRLKALWLREGQGEAAAGFSGGFSYLPICVILPELPVVTIVRVFMFEGTDFGTPSVDGVFGVWWGIFTTSHVTTL